MQHILQQAYEQARQALDDAYQNPDDTDLAYRLMARLENALCLLAVLTGQEQALKDTFVHLGPRLDDTAAQLDQAPDRGPTPQTTDPPRPFIPLGLMGGHQVLAHGLSTDGQVVTGSSIANADIHLDVAAFRWCAEHGKVNLGTLGGLVSRGTAVSQDGTLIVGESANSDGHTEAFHWTQDGGMRGLGFGDGTASRAFACTQSGSQKIIAGASTFAPAHRLVHAVRWRTDETGKIQRTDLGTLPGETESVAKALSADGSIVAGESYAGDPPRGQAVRWTQSGIESLGVLTKDRAYSAYSYAAAISADGNVIVGHSRSASKSHQAFRWTPKEGMVALEVGRGTPDAARSMAYGVSADGCTVVGSLIDGGDLEARAFIWDAAHGIRQLQPLLESRGAELTGWKLIYAQDVSANGQGITGWGINPAGLLEGWYADLSMAPKNPGTMAAGLASVSDLFYMLSELKDSPLLDVQVQDFLDKSILNTADTVTPEAH